MRMYPLCVSILIGVTCVPPLKHISNHFAQSGKRFLHPNHDCTRAMMQHCANGLALSIVCL